MKVLVATDAWHPQVNGVVRTLGSLARAATKLGATIDFLSPEGFPSYPVPTYPGLRLALAEPAGHRRAHRRGAAGRDPSGDRGTDRFCGARLLPPPRPAVHDQLHHAVSRIYLGALANSGSLDLRDIALVPRRRQRHDGRDALAEERAWRTRLPQSRHVDARRRRRSVPARPRHRSRFSAADLHDGRARRGREKSRSVPVARSARHAKS